MQLVQHQLPQVLVGDDFDLGECIAGRGRVGQRFLGGQPALAGLGGVEARVGQPAQQAQKQATVLGVVIEQVPLLVLTQALKPHQSFVEVLLAQVMEQLEYQDGHILPTFVAAVLR